MKQSKIKTRLTQLVSTTLAISLLSNTVLAAECSNAVHLRVGDKVTDCARIGLSEEYDLSLRKDLIEGDFNKKIIIEQNRILEMKDLQIQYTTQQKDLWQSDALRERAAYDKERNRTDTSFWLGFGVGLLTVFVTGYALGQVNR